MSYLLCRVDASSSAEKVAGLSTDFEAYRTQELTKHGILEKIVHELAICDGVFTPRGMRGSPT